MRFLPVEGIPKLKTVPLTTLWHENATVRVVYGDEQDQSVCLAFVPIQAYRMTTADCYPIPDGFVPKTVVEVLEWPWIEELRLALRDFDPYATFMDKARHFLIPGGDAFIEVVAWSVRIVQPGDHDSPW